VVKLAKKIKQWYPIVAPKIFNQIEIGETIGLEDQLIGRTVQVLVSDLTGDSRKTHIKLKLSISGVEAGKAVTEIKELELLRGYMRSIVRRRSTKIEESIKVVTRDNAKVTVKPLIITARLCTDTQETAIRKIIRQVVEDAAKQRTFDAFMLDLISEKLPKDLRQAITKLYPVKNAEIRKAEIVAMPKAA
jgi:small subunit ribosomal protein S3Ae